MAIEQADLEPLSDHYYAVADCIAGREVRPRDLSIADLRPGADREFFWKWAPKAGPALTGLAMIAKLRDLAPYQASTRELSRKNSTTVAWVGASALSHINSTTAIEEVRFSPKAMMGIQRAMLIIQLELEETFYRVARKDSDSEALYFLAQSNHLLSR